MFGRFAHPVKICHGTQPLALVFWGGEARTEASQATRVRARLAYVPGGRGKRSLHFTLVATPPSFLPVQSKGAASGRPFTTLGVLQQLHDVDGRSTHDHAMLDEPAT